MSPLNAPLDAEIELVDVAAGRGQYREGAAGLARDVRALRPRLAGIPESVTGRDRARQRRPRRPSRLRSTDPITEPFVTLLVEVELVARPSGARIHGAARPAGVRTGRVSRGERAGRRARHRRRRARGRDCRAARERPPPPPRLRRRSPRRRAQAQRRPPRPVARAAPRAGATRTRPRASAAEAALHVVQRGETLSAIAGGVADAERERARARLDARHLPGQSLGLPAAT